MGNFLNTPGRGDFLFFRFYVIIKTKKENFYVLISFQIHT